MGKGLKVLLRTVNQSEGQSAGCGLEGAQGKVEASQ